ncbi:MAG TPA: orotidine-5'-phosphate decarboxylase [Chloroflexota bacterium]
MVDFRERLEQARQSKRSAVCVGLDPRLDQLPPEFREFKLPEALLAFNKSVIDAVADVCIAAKPQAAFYELYGAEGFQALVETVRYAKNAGLLVIVDAKRNDIGSTAEAYAHAFLHPDGPFDADALTVNAYLGSDGVQPFLDVASKHGKGVFVLVKTSNPSSGELQDLEVEGEPVFELMARLVDGWDCEAVVGGTYPAQAAKARALMPKATILVPGYGAQGATAAGVAPSFRPDGRGAVVNNARGIIFAPGGPRAAAIAMRDALNATIPNIPSPAAAGEGEGEGVPRPNG